MYGNVENPSIRTADGAPKRHAPAEIVQTMDIGGSSRDAGLTPAIVKGGGKSRRPIALLGAGNDGSGVTTQADAQHPPPAQHMPPQGEGSGQAASTEAAVVAGWPNDSMSTNSLSLFKLLAWSTVVAAVVIPGAASAKSCGCRG